MLQQLCKLPNPLLTNFTTNINLISSCSIISFLKLNYSSTSSNIQKTKFDESLLDFLVCPVSKKELKYDKETNELVCTIEETKSIVRYPISDNGIPNFIPANATLLQLETNDDEQHK